MWSEKIEIRITDRFIIREIESLLFHWHREKETKTFRREWRPKNDPEALILFQGVSKYILFWRGVRAIVNVSVTS